MEMKLNRPQVIKTNDILENSRENRSDNLIQKQEQNPIRKYRITVAITSKK